jgi:hypothetical protein
MPEQVMNKMAYETKAFPNSADAIDKYIKVGITGVGFPTFFLFFRPHSRFVLNVGVK